MKFTITCNKCGSTDVAVWEFHESTLIECKNCDNCIDSWSENDD